MKTYKQIPEIKLQYKRGDIENRKLCSPGDVYALLKEFYDMDTIEYYESSIVLYLNQANKVIGWYKLSQGGISGTVIDIRTMFSIGLQCGAVGIIMSHNHPSGNLTPSNSDKNITNKAVEAGKFLDIVILDHIIVTDNGYLSMKEENLI